MKPSKITIHMNGACDTLTVDGREFDRSVMTRDQKHTARRIVREAFVAARA